MINSTLTKAIYAIWNNDPTLVNVPLRTTTITEGANFAYALLQIKEVAHEFDSSYSSVTDYIVTLTVYCGQDTTLATSVSDRIAAVYNFNNMLMAGATVLVFLPDSEDIITAPATDPTSHDVHVVNQIFQTKIHS